MSFNRSLSLSLLFSLFFSSNAFAKKLTTLSDVQGVKDTSPLVGSKVVLEGIVTADFQDEKSFAGFFMQTKTNKNEKRQNKIKQSEGIFVYESNIEVEIGDLIRVHGEVSEHHGVTQIADVTTIIILKNKQKLPSAVAISLPLAGYNLENLEGMRVTLDQSAIITDHYNYIRYGEFVVSSKILVTPTNRVPQGPKVKQLQIQNADDKLLIDDGKFNQFNEYEKINSKTPVHIGAQVQLVGIMHYAFDKYRIELTEAVEFLDSSVSRQSQPTPIAGEVKIASFNVRNYFTTIDKGQETCGPKQNFGCRGADSDDEFMRQQSKLVSAIRKADADIYAILELENNEDSIKVLVAALNADTKNDVWHYIDTGILGEDVIKVGLLYQIKKVIPVGEYKVLNPKVMPEFEADKNRDVLLQTFKDVNNNLFNVAVLHLKSKRCSDAIGIDLDQKDGQGCYNASRVKVAKQISDWLKQDPTGQNAESTLVIGDFNSYMKEDPISTFAKNGFNNLAHDLLTDENWTSVFRGEVGSIDHILANTNARKAAKGMTQWHINSIVMGWFDYNLEDLAKSKEKPENYYLLNPFASSDHDMVIAGFNFDN
jgi:predicted extracellular nuclease